MDNLQDISASSASLNGDDDQDMSQNATHLVPPRDPALAGAIAKRSAAPASRPLRMLLADRIDRQFPLIRSA